MRGEFVPRVLEGRGAPADRQSKPPSCLIVIGANVGGPQALAQLLPAFPASFPGSIIVVQSVRAGFTKVLADQLSSVCKLPAYEPNDGQALQPSTILIVPARASLKLQVPADAPERSCEVALEDVESAPERRTARIDHTMTSAAQVFGPDAVGVLLTGLGDDGTKGMRAIADAGGLTVAQDVASSVVHDMPARAIQTGAVSDVIPLWGIADRVIRQVMGEVNADAA